MKNNIIKILIMLIFLNLFNLSNTGLKGNTLTGEYLKVKIQDGFITSYEEYKISFLLKNKIEKGDVIEILFDEKIIPPFSRTVEASSILIDNENILKDAKFLETKLVILANKDLEENIEHTILIKKDALIKNPTEPGHFKIFLINEKNKVYISSNYYTITNISKISPISFELIKEDDSRFEFQIKFKTGRNGKLLGEVIHNIPEEKKDRITIRLSPSISKEWPQNFDRTNIEINFYPVATPLKIKEHFEDEEERKEKEIAFNVNRDILSDSEVFIRIKFNKPFPRFNFFADNYIHIYTTKEPEMVKMELDKTNLSLPKFLFKITPIMPDGLNNWYITNPLVSFEIDKNIKAYYSINEKPFVELSEPFLVSDGKNILRYYAIIDKKETQVYEKMIKVDTKKPEVSYKITQDKILSSRIFTLEVEVKEENFKEGFVLIEDKSAQLKYFLGKGKNLINFVKRNGLDVLIKATDEAGLNTELRLQF